MILRNLNIDDGNYFFNIEQHNHVSDDFTGSLAFYFGGSAGGTFIFLIRASNYYSLVFGTVYLKFYNGSTYLILSSNFSSLACLRIFFASNT